MIKFISTEILEQFNDDRLNPALKMIVLAVSGYIYQKYGEPVYVTSIYRPEDTKSVHAYWRGVDMDNDAGLDHKEKQEVADWVNKIFIYDLTRPDKVVCLYHTVKGRGGDHLHLQVHPNTALRK